MATACTTADNIQKRRYYLVNLPAALPISEEPDFRNFSLKQDLVEDEGEDVAYNREYEVMLGSRSAGVKPFLARGPGLQALVPVMEIHLQTFPNSFYLGQ